MEKLLEKLDNLKQVLDDNAIIKDIKELNKRLQKEEKLLDLITEYRKTLNPTLKEQIINNELFKEYKLKETDLNILILQLNNQLKTITKKDKCSL